MTKFNPQDMDELMRRAAEKYPLRTDSSDWDRLSGDLDRDPSLIIPPVHEEGKRRRRGLFWLFLLLPLSGVVYYTWHLTAPANERPAGTAYGQPGGSVDHPGSGHPGADRSASGNLVAQAGSGYRTAQTGTGRGVSQSGSGHRTAQNATVFSGLPGSREPGLAGNGGMSNSQMMSGDVASSDARGPAARGLRPGKLDIHLAGVSGGISSGRPGPAAVTSPLTLSAEADSLAKKAKDKAKDKGRQSPFYAGILAAPDLSLVKFQSVRKLGYTAGILLGYNINRKWAVETGLYLDKKQYYTDGEYFSKSKMPPPYQRWNFKTFDGYCNMLEIPVNIRYNFSSGNKIKWFVTAGASTYLMSGENYSYQAEYNGWSWPGSYANTHPSQYWFPVINFSIGYEQKLGKVGALRLEPYMRIPTSGIGTGELPIMSAGLNIGITRRIWK